MTDKDKSLQRVSFQREYNPYIDP